MKLKFVVKYSKKPLMSIKQFVNTILHNPAQLICFFKNTRYLKKASGRHEDRAIYLLLVDVCGTYLYCKRCLKLNHTDV